MPLVFVNIRRKLLAILYRLCYTVSAGCGRGGFLPFCGFLRGRARKEPFSVERTAKRAAAGAFCAACPFVYEKCLAFFGRVCYTETIT